MFTLSKDVNQNKFQNFSTALNLYSKGSYDWKGFIRMCNLH